MDLFRALDISASALAAQRTRIEVITENLANTDSTVTATGRPYQRKVVKLQAVGPADTFPATFGADAAPQGGVRVAEVAQLQDPPRRVYQPGHPQAGPDGFVELPNMNPLVEMTDMLSSTRAYEANVTAFQATKTMATKLLELLR
jgi:flagellar basal-body rod protein FlgC